MTTIHVFDSQFIAHYPKRIPKGTVEAERVFARARSHGTMFVLDDVIRWRFFGEERPRYRVGRWHYEIGGVLCHC